MDNEDFKLSDDEIKTAILSKELHMYLPSNLEYHVSREAEESKVAEKKDGGGSLIFCHYVFLFPCLYLGLSLVFGLEQ